MCTVSILLVSTKQLYKNTVIMYAIIRDKKGQKYYIECMTIRKLRQWKHTDWKSHHKIVWEARITYCMLADSMNLVMTGSALLRLVHTYTNTDCFPSIRVPFPVSARLRGSGSRYLGGFAWQAPVDRSPWVIVAGRGRWGPYCQNRWTDSARHLCRNG